MSTPTLAGTDCVYAITQRDGSLSGIYAVRLRFDRNVLQSKVSHMLNTNSGQSVAHFGIEAAIWSAICPTMPAALPY
jgi:hypothetical protein